MAKAAHWLDTDAEVRKCGEQTGLDTLVRCVTEQYTTRRLAFIVYGVDYQGI